MEYKDRIEKYFIEMDMEFKEVDEGTWMIEDDFSHLENIIVKLLDPIIVFRVNIMKVPDNNREEFFKTLLELNANDLVHGAYGIEGDKVVIVDTLQVENLDINEFQSTIESIGLALVQQYELLSKFNQ